MLTHRWHALAESQYPWERDALQYLRDRLPDSEPVRVWANAEFLSLDGRLNEVDAIVLARAGLVRLGRESEATEVLEPEVSLPAVGQGALAVELRAGDERTAALLAPLADEATTIAVAAERGVMIAVQGGCQTPVAAHAVRQGSELWLRALLAEPDGTDLRRGERRVSFPVTAAEAEAVGRNLGVELATPR